MVGMLCALFSFRVKNEIKLIGGNLRGKSSTIKGKMSWTDGPLDMQQFSTAMTTPSLSVSPPLASVTATGDPCQAIMAGVARVEEMCFAEAQSKARSGLQQDEVNAILLEQAHCECKRAYSGIRPDVQLAFGHCAGRFATPEGQMTFSRRVTQCLDGDYGGFVLERSYSLAVDGASVGYSDPSYQPPTYTQPLITLRSTSGGPRKSSSVRFLLPYFIVLGLGLDLARVAAL